MATTLNDISASEEEFQLATYQKMPIAAERGESVWIYASNGDKYLDLYGGHAVAGTGHCHPQVVKAIREQAGELLGEFELPDGDVLAGDLSVGNRQRLNLAIALLGDPDALLLDEPTAALDPEQRRRLWERLDAQRETGVALLFVTQHGDEVERHADRVVALREGAVSFAGPAAEYAAA